jgi:hypothetical protein
VNLWLGDHLHAQFYVLAGFGDGLPDRGGFSLGSSS